MSKTAPKTGKPLPKKVKESVRIGVSFTNNDVLQNLIAENRRTGISIGNLIRFCVSDKYGKAKD